MTDEQDGDDVYGRVYDVIFDHLKGYYKEELEALELYKKAPSDNDDLYPRFALAAVA